MIARTKWFASIINATAAIASVAGIWAQSASPDRVVAEWMLRMGGSIVLAGQTNPIADLVDYMLFVDDAPLGGKIEGSSGFAEKFSATGPRVLSAWSRPG